MFHVSPLIYSCDRELNQLTIGYREPPTDSYFMPIKKPKFHSKI